MNKKLLCSCLSLISVLAVTGCDKNMNKFKDLEKGQVIDIGGTRYTNYEVTETNQYDFYYYTNFVYNLRRYSYNVTNAINYDGYYYLFETTSTQDHEILGDYIEKTTYNYAYLSYGKEAENVALKTTVKNSVEYKYKGGFISKDFTYTLQLNGYFANYEKMAELCEELAHTIDISGTRKYYVDVTTPVTSTTTVNKYTNTYYYIEKTK